MLWCHQGGRGRTLALWHSSIGLSWEGCAILVGAVSPSPPLLFQKTPWKGCNYFALCVFELVSRAGEDEDENVELQEL